MKCCWTQKYRMQAYSKWVCGVFLVFLNFSGNALASQDFVVLGNEGVWVREGSTILSGDIGANQASEGPYLAGVQELTIGHDVVVQNSDSRIMGDMIRLKSGSQVHDLLVNTFLGTGQIIGSITAPIILPLISELPFVPPVNPGSQDIDVQADGVLTLQAGHYGRLKARPGAIVTLQGGLYHFLEWDLREGAQVLATGPVEIQVKDQIDTRRHTIVGPAPGVGTLTAADVLIIGRMVKKLI